MTKNEILTFLSEKKEFLSENYGVTSIGLFGSYARDEAREDSDIDIAIEMKREHKFMNFFNLKYYLQDQFKKPVDIGIESTLKPSVKKYVKREIIYV